MPGASDPYPTHDVKIGIVTRRRLRKSETLDDDIDKVAAKHGRRLLRQRTVGDLNVDSSKRLKVTLRNLVSRFDKKCPPKVTRNESVSGLYPEMTRLHVSKPQENKQGAHGTTSRSMIPAGTCHDSCNEPESMDVDEHKEVVRDTSARPGSSRSDIVTGHLNVMQTADDFQRIADIFVVQKLPNTVQCLQSQSQNTQRRADKIQRHLASPKIKNGETGRRTSQVAGTASLGFCTKILDFLYMSSIEAAYNEPLLCKLNIQVLIDLSNVPALQVPLSKKSKCPCPCKRDNHFRSRLNVGVDDIDWENISQHFNDINNFIEGARKSKKNVLVFSYHGHSRAPVAVIQYIMRNFRLSLHDATSMVRSQHADVAVNPGFWRALRRLETELFQEFGELPFRSRRSSTLLSLAPAKTKTAWTGEF